jgi:nucleoside-diphosphate-sugar epimerase
MLVTGASGFLGAHVCSRMVAAGAEVHGVSRTARPAAEAPSRWWHADVEDLGEARRLVSEVRPEVILHLGGLVNGAPELGLVVPTFQSLVTSTVNLLQVAAEQSCRRVVLVGSLEEVDGGEVSPTSPYGAAKSAATAYGRMFGELFGLGVVVTRPQMAYGPGQPCWKVIPSTILALLRGEAPRLSSGARAVDWIYVDDVVDGLLMASVAPGIEGATLDLGSGRLTPIREIVLMLVELLDAEVTPVFGALADRPRMRERPADVARTNATIGWKPTTPLDVGLMRTVEWYRQRHHLPGRSEP